MACSNSRLDECNNVCVDGGFNGQQVTLQESAIWVFVQLSRFSVFGLPRGYPVVISPRASGRFEESGGGSSLIRDGW